MAQINPVQLTFFKRLSKNYIQRSIIFGVLILVVIVASLSASEFMTFTNMQNVTRQVSIIIITGCAATLLLISGNIDLSLGSVLALTSVLCAQFAVWGLPLWLSILSATLVGGLIGILNGVLVTRLLMPSVIATLGTQFIARGMALILAHGETINKGLPDNFGFLGRGNIGPVPMPLLLTIGVVIIFVFIQNRTILGRYAFAIGGNRITSTLSGINVDGITIFLYCLTGILAGFSGTIMAARLGVGHPTIGVGFEFDVIVAMIIGGTSLSGGEGYVIGMVIGALIVGFLTNVLNLIGMHTFYQYIVKGVVVILAVILDIFIRKRIK